MQIQVLLLEEVVFSHRVHWLVFCCRSYDRGQFMSSFYSWYQSFLSQALCLLSHKIICFSNIFPRLLVCPMTWWDTEAYDLKWRASSRICSGLWDRRGPKLKAKLQYQVSPCPLGRRWGGWRVSPWDIDRGQVLWGTKEDANGGLLVTTPSLNFSVSLTVGLAESGK